MTTKLDYKKVKHSIEIGDKVYDIPTRTPKMQAAIDKWNKEDRMTLNTFEALKSFLIIFFGQEEAEEIIGDEDEVDLDFLETVYKQCEDLYLYKARKDNEKSLTELNKMTKQIAPLLNQAKKVQKVKR